MRRYAAVPTGVFNQIAKCCERTGKKSMMMSRCCMSRILVSGVRVKRSL